MKKPDAGRIILNDRVLVDTATKIFLEPQQRRLGVVFQDGRLFPHLSAKKNLLFGSKNKRKSAKSDSAKLDFSGVVETLELEHLLERRPANLSGGERQRVAIGRALLANPELLLFDEPFSAIDTSKRLELLPYISRVQREFNLPLLIISHDLPELLQLSDQLLLIEEGKLLAQGNSRELIFSTHASKRLLESGVSSSFYGVVTAKDQAEGTAQITIINPENSSPAAAPQILAPFQSSIGKGEYVRAQLAPEDIILSSAPVEYISAQNQLRGVITRSRRLGGRTLVEVDCSGFKLITEVTNKSSSDFSYTPGRNLWVLFKTWAVTYSLYASDYHVAPKPLTSTPKHQRMLELNKK